jgi:hypothetical protein
MCRKDKNCGGCKRVNFCSIWNNNWPTPNPSGTALLQAYSDYKVKDLPALIVDRIANSVDKTFYSLITYMKEENLVFDDKRGYTRLIKKDNQQEII